jgi:hypothetical protein
VLQILQYHLLEIVNVAMLQYHLSEIVSVAILQYHLLRDRQCCNSSVSLVRDSVAILQYHLLEIVNVAMLQYHLSESLVLQFFSITC